MASIELTRYFGLEKGAALRLTFIGLISIALASWLKFAQSPYEAMLWPLVVFGILQIVIGIGIARRTDGQIAQLQQGFHSNQGSTIDQEQQRMLGTLKTFKMIKLFYIVLILIALYILFFHAADSLALQALGMGLLLQCVIMLLFDLSGEQRAKGYIQWLKEIPRNS